ncbi:MAG: GntR family transcriptional regulator [Treponema sp.]|jgi:GntR family transcriptional regulator|nr:GntR family transcriptional regulator [Treponema sp.]
MEKVNLTGEPVYIQIEYELRLEITSGRINPGQMLPSESALMSRFNAGRETVRRSLKELEHRGLIYTRPGKGYFVAEPEHNLYSFYFSDDDKNFYSKYNRVSYETPSEEVSFALALPDRRKVIKISRVIMAQEDPVAYDEKYIPYDKGSPIVEAEIKYAVFPDIVSSKSPPFAFYTKMEIGSEIVTSKLQKILNCKLGESLLVLCRHIIGLDGRRLGYGKKYLTAKWGRIEAVSGYRDRV